MNYQEIIQTHQERQEWLTLLAGEIGNLNQNISDQLGIIELIVSKLKRSNKNLSNELQLSLDSLSETKNIMATQSKILSVSHYINKPFCLKKSLQEILQKIDALRQSCSVSIDVQYINNCSPIIFGDLDYFSLAVTSILCYTIEKFLPGRSMSVLVSQSEKFAHISIIADVFTDLFGSGLKKALLENQLLFKAHTIFKDQGAGFSIVNGDQVAFEAFWPLSC